MLCKTQPRGRDITPDRVRLRPQCVVLFFLTWFVPWCEGGRLSSSISSNSAFIYEVWPLLRSRETKLRDQQFNPRLLYNQMYGYEKQDEMGGTPPASFDDYIIRVQMEISSNFSALQLSFISLITALHNWFALAGRCRTSCAVAWGQQRGLNPFPRQFE